MEERKIRVAITHGDINGVGYEVILKTFADHRLWLAQDCRLSWQDTGHRDTFYYYQKCEGCSRRQAEYARCC